MKMQAKAENKIKSVLSCFICVLFMLLSAYAGMQFTGRLGFQIALTFVLSLIFSFVTDKVGVKSKTLAVSLCVSTSFWVICALIGQMLLKGTFFIFNSPWKYMFYYDSIGMVFIVMIVVTAYRRFKAFRKKDEETVEEYEKFYSTASVVFTVFYIIVLIYCFFIIRFPGGERETPNFDPLDVFKVTFFSGYLDYERLVLFLGNIAIFIPLGYLLCHRLNRGGLKIVLVLLPVVLSSAIEFSQYYFGMGHPDVDDVILNVIGFYIGVLLKIIFDKVFALRKN